MRRYFCLIAALTLAACSSSGDDVEATLRAETAGLKADPAEGRVVPSIDDALPQLGKLLFFSKALGGEMDSACVTCHHPFLGGGDGLALPIGVGADVPDLLGPGRVPSSAAADFDGGPNVPRNAPTTFNLLLWDKTLFHDGRIESLSGAAGMSGADGSGIRTPDSLPGIADPGALRDLAHAQARFPVTSAAEMRGFTYAPGSNDDLRNALAGRLGQYGASGNELPGNGWLALFQSAFNSTASADALVTYDSIATAIAAYEASQTFVDTPWRRWVDGDASALTDAEKRGALVFFRAPAAGGAGCAGCHSGAFFTDEAFHVVAFPQIGRGKGNGPTGDGDFGRFRETSVEADRFAFRTPSLLNVAVTGPWGHAGTFDTLEDVVRHHLDPQSSLANFDYDRYSAAGISVANARANSAAALDQLDTLRASGASMLPEVSLSDVAVSDLVQFLHALTDPCVTDRACLSQWIPSDTDPDPDGLRLNALGADGNPL